MEGRKGISPTLRWSVFVRDGFTCRYCGAQAGQECVDLVVDHVVSVAEGGDGRFDNLVTSCRTCNAGKGAKSLQTAPASSEVVERADAQAKTLSDLAGAISRALQARKDLRQKAVNLKCDAYGRDSIFMPEAEITTVIKLVREFGADKVLDWYASAVSNRVSERSSARYICGCARVEREGRS